jgi:minor extracellular serine protease Vpr
VSSSVTLNAAVNAANFSPHVAPGSLASVFGVFPFTNPAGAASFPLPTVLSGLSLQLTGAPLSPLFYANGTQVNLQIPWELAGQTQATLTPIVNSLPTQALIVNLVNYAPAIFSVNNSGTGQGAILDQNYHLVDSTHPAGPGVTILQIFCTGLGPVTNQPATGAPSPSNPPATTTTVPTVTIGAAPAHVEFSGLAPGFVGLYQVNALVPSSASTGNSIPVSLSIGGVTSNAVTIAVQ